MRRSAAPSFRQGSKRGRFINPCASQNLENSTSLQNFSPIANYPKTSLVSHPVGIKPLCRNPQEIIELIMDSFSESEKAIIQDKIKNSNENNMFQIITNHLNETQETSFKSAKEIFNNTDDPIETCSSFNKIYSCQETKLNSNEINKDDKDELPSQNELKKYFEEFIEDLKNENKKMTVSHNYSSNDIKNTKECQEKHINILNIECKDTISHHFPGIMDANTFYQAQKENKTLESCPSLSIGDGNIAYTVVWCKRSARKHKKWEGDGILIIKNRSATLKDTNNKVIDQGSGYLLKEIMALQEGSKFFIGGKECELLQKISDEEYLKSQCWVESQDENANNKSFEKNYIPSTQTKKLSSNKIGYSLFINEQKICKSEENESKNENNIYEQENSHYSSEVSIDSCDLIFPLPPLSHKIVYNKEKLPVVNIQVEPFLAQHLRPHQKEGIIFMYKCIMGFQDNIGEGVILADEMGLGKTLQCIALIWTLYKQGPYGGKPILKKIIIITPSSLVNNWKKEFIKWLGKSRLNLFAVDQQHKVKDYIALPKPVLILSYEMFLRSAEALADIPFDLVICDEGHRIKNLNIKISNVVNCLSTTRRILLTGTPIQNDLQEFFSIVEFVNPGVLGTIQSFRKNYEKPIMQSRNTNCCESEKELGEERSIELANITKMFILRRTQEVINNYLPPKTETVVFCRPTPLQQSLYRHLIGSTIVTSFLSPFASTEGSLHLTCISALRKICNHPSLLYNQNKNDEFDDDTSLLCYMQSAFPSNYTFQFNDSGKMRVLEKILSTLFSSKTKEKIVIVSAFTQTLNVIEKLCNAKRYCFLRLDGSTTTSNRQNLVESFNLPYSKYIIFLLSSKAGGVGFNLIGASRILLYDIDWNPANDMQAMARVWRDGQKHPVYVYRLLTTGTIEEKIYQRQVCKQSLSGALFDSYTKSKLHFSREELKDLFTFHENIECLTHNLINCSCLNMEHVSQGNKENINNTRKDSENSKLQNVNMSELLKWKHKAGPITAENFPDLCLSDCGDNITFVFTNCINAKKEII